MSYIAKTFRITEKQNAIVKRMAKKHKVSEGTFIRQLIDTYAA